ncbi:hypothetical protein BAR24_16115 [Gluconobacter oxydans]|uniref:hypothetical protein n=1 Tax=Gluconobacter thailandicus TaxID=257438 RepID=UPI000299674A|nr:hypothetical protein [Gluconobacter thailandicus]AFW01519.1 hypothetical protein B932_1952 [Gluconobacter oxydans H24]ANQ42840.1 hypothetical protein BAR24_16115 [Gluconobacter oxydans]
MLSQILPSLHAGGDQNWSSVLVGTQLASTERFQDFLKSYVHTGEEPVSKTPVRNNTAQLSGKKEPDPSPETPNPIQDNKIQKASTSSTVGQSELRQNCDQKTQKTPVLKAEPQSVQLRSGGPSTSSAEKISSETDEKEVQSKSSSGTEEPESETSISAEESVKNTPESPAAKDVSLQVLNLTTQIRPESGQTIPSEPVAMQNTATGSAVSAPDNATQSVDDNLAAPIASTLLDSTPEDEVVSVEDDFSVSEQSATQENISFPGTIGSSLTPVSNMRAEGSDAADGSKGQASTVETVSARSDVRSAPAQEDMPVISHLSSASHLNTEIEMSLGEGGKVHVSIDQAEDGERHVHIRAENPDVLQSLAEDKSELFATLNQGIIPISPDQPIIPTDLTLSLMGHFSESSGDGSGQENRLATGDAEHLGSPSISRNKTQASAQSSRTLLRGVVDLTA